MDPAYAETALSLQCSKDYIPDEITILQQGVADEAVPSRLFVWRMSTHCRLTRWSRGDVDCGDKYEMEILESDIRADVPPGQEAVDRRGNGIRRGGRAST